MAIPYDLHQTRWSKLSAILKGKRQSAMRLTTNQRATLQIAVAATKPVGPRDFVGFVGHNASSTQSAIRSLVNKGLLEIVETGPFRYQATEMGRKRIEEKNPKLKLSHTQKMALKVLRQDALMFNLTEEKIDIGAPIKRITLESLWNRGLVRSEYISATAIRWSLTEAGRTTLTEIV